MHRVVEPGSLKLTVSVIVHDDFSHIQKTLDSLAANSNLPYQLTITVNQGAAEEIERLRVRFPEAHWVINDHPVGFAANHNAVMRHATTPFVALINDDIEFQPNTLDRLVDYLEAHPQVGLVGPRVQNPDGSPQLSVFSDPTLARMIYRISGLSWLTRHGGLVRRMLQRTGLAQSLGVVSLDTRPITRDVPVVVGVVMVVRRSAYLEAGLIDEETRLYAEEFGWHLRLRRHHWKVTFVADAVVTHFNRESDLSDWKLAEHRKSILNYFLIYKPAWQAAFIRVAIVLSCLPWILIYAPFDRARAKDHWQTAQIGLRWKRPQPADQNALNHLAH